MRKNNYLCSRIPLLKRDVAQKSKQKNKIFNKKTKTTLKPLFRFSVCFRLCALLKLHATDEELKI